MKDYQDSSCQIHRTVDDTVMKDPFLGDYFGKFSNKPELDVRSSRKGRGLFEKQAVQIRGIVCEYTGVRLSGEYKRRRMRALLK